MEHVQDMFAERELCNELANCDAQRSTQTKVFCLDDKLGSHWQFLPMPPASRSSKSTAGRWQHRQTIQ
eukprot:4321844-Pleurochrysis_carterae.AAC.1